MPQQKTNPKSNTTSTPKSSDSNKKVSAANANKPEEKKIQSRKNQLK